MSKQLIRNCNTEVAIANAFLLHKKRPGSHKRCRTQLDFRVQLYTEIFETFRYSSVGSTVETIPGQNLAEMHSKVRRDKRGYCSYCSSGKRKVVDPNAPKSVTQSRLGLFGCLECNVPLCKKGACWDLWHST